MNWTVEDGLVQSQASFIAQDKFRRLWIGTQGGISLFDGKKFSAFTIREGLPSNQVTGLLCDRTGNIHIATSSGLGIFDGAKMRVAHQRENRSQLVTDLAEDDHGTVRCLAGYRLLKLKGDSLVPEKVSAVKEIITALNASAGALLAYVYQDGTYALQNGSWKKIYAPSKSDRDIIVHQQIVTKRGDTLAVSNSGLFTVINGVMKRKMLPVKNFICLAEDAAGSVWIGTTVGAYKLEGENGARFTEVNGFTNNMVSHIFRDAENNMWFATNADGIYKFGENTFTYYDRSSGLLSAIIMGVAQSKDGDVYAVTYNGGLYRIAGNGIMNAVSKAEALFTDCKINCLFRDSHGDFWIGTTNKGLLKYSVAQGLKSVVPSEDGNGAVTVIGEGFNGRILAGVAEGFLVLNGDSIERRVQIPDGHATVFRRMNDEMVLIGTSAGLLQMDSANAIKPYLPEIFGNASLLCLSITRSGILAGTTDKGIMHYDLKNRALLRYDQSHGLPSNFIYSISADSANNTWVGTGFGISHLVIGDTGQIMSIRNYGRSDGLLGMECNHNAILRDSEGTLWFGTTRGLFRFDPRIKRSVQPKPYVTLQSVKLFSTGMRDSTNYTRMQKWFPVPEGLDLRSAQNHLTFDLSSVYFTDPGDVLFRYKLEGLDKDYNTSTSPQLVYASLPPGHYTLRVKGITKNGTVSANEIAYSFNIRKAFYQTRLFQVAAILFLIGSGALIAFLVTRSRQRRKARHKAQLERIREEEFMKLRQRTAEDFHDEMGNSLTRIAVLTDILKTRLNGREQEVTRLVTQIKENTNALYHGSRDIIWSLNAAHDGLFEIAEHIRDIGQETFQDTSTEFSLHHNIPRGCPLSLKLDHNRNLSMIMKEAFSNIVKHAHADNASVELVLEGTHLSVEVKDDGNGFDIVPANGNGLRNMRSRAERMNGSLEVIAARDNGTILRMQFNQLFQS